LAVHGALRILFVSAYLPSRVAGAPVRFLGLLSALARTHSVSVLAFAPETSMAAESAEQTGGYCEEVVTVPNRLMGLRGASKRLLQLRSLMSPRSQSRTLHASASFQAALDDMAARSKYEIVQVEGCYMAQYRFPTGSAVVLDEHNVEYEILRRSSNVARGLPRKLFNRLDYVKLRTEEERTWRSADACAVTSPRDEAAVLHAVPNARTAVVPNAVDLDFFSPRGLEPEPSTLLFFGALNYFPNVDAVTFFASDVMPLLERTHPSLKLVVVGSLPPPSIQRLAAANVTVTGAVDDVRPYLERARAVVVPLRVGGGTRLKILEALAMGKPVISTRVGAEGLAVTGDQDILLGDDAESFAAQVRRALDDDALTRRLRTAARSLVESKYQWTASARTLEGLYASVLAGREPASADHRTRPRPGRVQDGAAPEIEGRLTTN
jgi:glycosyltransferase involved in cell wall biosynthesis